ncbi:Predicted DNA-binding transcriptional regulator YafY, contains an HTH and WYL domains [Ruminococcaceae bacterium YRB3002]|nr:Predicted DNA-binding transcriptional regulator YafY, contains an HTH and WYL domains [Ruminococcaceae bacterium YRB3002]
MIPTKKMLPMLILDILRKYTDGNHTLDQKDIIEKLRIEYDLQVERKAVRRNIEELINMGFPIEYTEKPREGNVIWTDFWIAHEFTDAELRLLIDGLLFSKHVPYSQCKELVAKLEGLSNEYFKSYVSHIKTLPDAGTANQQIFLTIAVLDEAISKERQVSFHYVNYGTDKKLHPKPDDNGNPREYIINPYQMVAQDGKYYLICNYDPYNDVSNYRLDRIADIKILDTKRKPFSKLSDSNGNRLNLGEYMKRHIYMYSSEDVRVRFKIVPVMISDIIDFFGKEVSFEEETDTYVIVSAKVTEAAMIQFAKSYAPDVVILEPESMVKEMREWAEKVKKVYGGKNEQS